MAGFTGTVASRAQSPVTYSRKPPAAAARTDPLLLKPAAAAVASPVMVNGSAAAIAALNSANAVLQRVATLPKAEERKVYLRHIIYAYYAISTCRAITRSSLVTSAKGAEHSLQCSRSMDPFLRRPPPLPQDPPSRPQS